MSPLLLLVAITILLAVYFYRQAYSRPLNFPPGPPRLPIWGSYWLLLIQNYYYLHVSLMQMCNKYKSKVLGFYLGPYPCVVACSYDGVNEILRRPEYQARPDILLARTRSFGGRFGVIFSDGPVWAEERRYFLRHMRDFGFDRRFETTETVMNEEIRDLVELLHGDWKDEAVCKEGRVLFSRLFAPYALNAMWSMFGGDRFARKDHHRLRVVSQGAVEFVKCSDASGKAVSMTTWLQYASPRGFGVQDVKDCNKPIIDFVKKSILEHKATFSDCHMRDFIDMYLQTMKDAEQNPHQEVFTDDQLLLTAMDAVLATSTALPGSMTFLFHCLLHYPEVQKKIQDELDDVIGRDKPATLDDRQYLPYLEATIRESMRRVTLAPLSIPHFSTEDTYFQGYFVPKSTIMYPHIWAAHMDPDVWGDPETFRPERFLDEEGNLLKKDLSIPFGAGKRLCTGETFSRQMMFLLTAAMLQSFSFAAIDPLNKSPIESALHGFTLVPPDIWGKIIPRK